MTPIVKLLPYSFIQSSGTPASQVSETIKTDHDSDPTTIDAVDATQLLNGFTSWAVANRASYTEHDDAMFFTG